MEPLSALLVIIWSLSIRFLRAIRSCFVRLSFGFWSRMGRISSMLAFVLLVKLFSTGLVLSVVSLLVHLMLKALIVCQGLYVSGIVDSNDVLCFMSTLEIIWVFSLAMPLMMSSVSTCFGLGMNDNPLPRTEISWFDKVYDDRFIILLDRLFHDLCCNFLLFFLFFLYVFL